MNKYYKTGDFVFSLSLPCSICDEEPFSLFLTDERNSAYNADFSFCSEINRKSSAPLFISDRLIAAESDRGITCYYINRDNKEIFAAREINKSDRHNTKIFINENYRDTLWQRVIFSVLGLEEAAAMNNALILHASFIDIGNEAVLFTGDSGIGKSTQAHLWEKHRSAEIINEDKALIFIKDGRAFASGLPFSGSSKICKNKCLPLKTVISLSQAPENSVCVLSGTARFLKIFKNIYQIPYDSLILGKQLDTAKEISEKINVLSLACTPDKTAVEITEKYL